MNPCDRPSPLPTCVECLRPRRGNDAKCVCGTYWPVSSPLTLDPFTRELGLREVRKAKRNLLIARALRDLERSETVTAA